MAKILGGITTSHIPAVGNEIEDAGDFSRKVITTWGRNHQNMRG